MKTVLMGGDQTAPAANEYHGFFSFSSNTQWGASEVAGKRGLIPCAGTLSNLYVSVVTAPGAGTSVIYTVYKNGSSTALAVTISETSTSGSNLSDSISLSAGDWISIRVTVTGSPVLAVSRFSATFNSSSVKQSIMIGGRIASFSALRYTGFCSGGSLQLSDATVSEVYGIAGTLKNLYVECSAAPGASKSWVFTVYKNGSSTAITCTVSGSDTIANDTVNTLAVLPNDVLSLEINPVNTPAGMAVNYGVQFDPTTDGEFPISGYETGNMTNNATRYRNIEGGNGGWNATESSINMLAGESFKIKNLYVRTGAAPGAGNSYTFTIYNGGSSSALSAVLSDAVTGGSDTINSIIVAAGSTLSIAEVPASLPTTTTACWGMTGYFDIASGGIMTTRKGWWGDI